MSLPDLPFRRHIPVKSEPPSGHTGVLAPGVSFGGGSGAARHSQTEIGVDYLSVTIHSCAYLVTVIDWIEETYAAPIFWDNPEYGYRGYLHHYRSDVGAVVAWGMGGSASGDHFHVNLSGSFCRSVGAVAVLRFIQRLESLDCRVNYSRFDFCIDDYARRQNCEGIVAAVTAGNYNTRLKRIQYWNDFHPDQGNRVLGVNFGSRGGLSYIRIYDKGIESRGEIDAIRYELELRDERATLQVKQLVHLPESEWQDNLISLFRATLDFVSYSNPEHKERGVPLGWWADITGGGDKSRLSIPKPKISIRRSVQWVHRQWSATFAMLGHAFGYQQMVDFLYQSSQQVTLNSKQNQALSDFLSFVATNIRAPSLCLN